MGENEGKEKLLGVAKSDYIVKWEKVGIDTYRYRVPYCGWLVKVVSSKIKMDESKINVVDNTSSLCYVPDPDGHWI